MENKTFNPLSVSSKFAICGLPIRVDTYKTCSFGCVYCFANNRKICEFEKELKVGKIATVERKLEKIFVKGKVDSNVFLDTLIANGYDWHLGGMSDPLQPIEKDLHVTRNLLEVTNKYGIHILVSTKSNQIYGCDFRPELHSFQLSVSNVHDRTDIEPGVVTIKERYEFFRRLKDNGFKVGIRIQPFIPGITTTEIVEMFEDADHFTLEGIKLVPQNQEHRKECIERLQLNPSDFKQMGLLNLKPEIRLELYKPFVEMFEKKHIPYSIADNDLHYLGTSKCCCGDALVNKTTTFSNTFMLHEYGANYSKEDVDKELHNCGVCDCKCNQYFTSNRQEGCITVQDFYNKRFSRKNSPFSPQYQYIENN